MLGLREPLKNSGSHIDASHSRQPLVKGERLVCYEANAVMTRAAQGCSHKRALFSCVLAEEQYTTSRAVMIGASCLDHSPCFSLDAIPKVQIPNSMQPILVRNDASSIIPGTPRQSYKCLTFSESFALARVRNSNCKLHHRS